MENQKANKIILQTMLIANGNFFNLIYESILSILDILSLYIGILLCVAFFTLAERKFMGSVQRRLGPNVVGLFGLLQAFADALKLIFKEILIPYKSNKILFILAPIMFLTLALLSWAVIPLAIDVFIADLLYGLLFIYLISSLAVFGVIIAGWASNSKYPFLGALRSAAQMISYEVSMGFILIIVSILTGTFNIIDIILSQRDIWLVFLLFPIFLMFLVSILAETNRAPFDLPEAEAELVAGYNLEYSGIMFAMFFLAEYSNMLLMSLLTIHLFFGGWLYYPINISDYYYPIKIIYTNIYIIFNNFLFNLYLYEIYFKDVLFKFLFYFQALYAYINIMYIKSKQIIKLDIDNIDFILFFLGAYLNKVSLLFYKKFSIIVLTFKMQSQLVDTAFFIEVRREYLFIVVFFEVYFKMLYKSFFFLGLKLILLSIFFVLTRASLPRYRYDQLMYIGWKSFLPFTLGYLFFIIGIFYFFNIFPETSGFPFLTI